MLLFLAYIIARSSDYVPVLIVLQAKSIDFPSALSAMLTGSKQV